jgi:hypothetical protein
MKGKPTAALIIVLVAFVLFVCPAPAQAQRETPTGADSRPVPRDRERYRDPDPRANDIREMPALRSGLSNTEGPDYLAEAVSRLTSRSKNFQKYLSAVPNDVESMEGTNDEVRVFGETARELKKRISGNHALASGVKEANKLLEVGARLDEFVSQKVTDKRTMSEWKKIRQDLRVVAHMYGFRQSPFYNSQ